MNKYHSPDRRQETYFIVLLSAVVSALNDLALPRDLKVPYADKLI